MNNVTSKTPVVIYNTEKKEMVGIFESFSAAGRYVYGRTCDSKYNINRVWLSCYKNQGLKTNRLGFRVVARVANEEHINTLGDNIFVIFKDYPIPNKLDFKDINNV